MLNILIQFLRPWILHNSYLSLFSISNATRQNSFVFKFQSLSTYPKLSTVIRPLFLYFSWGKARVLYYINNWVYTTNHKRIAVNYFWFVILSGIFGMVLATVIRLELAYPGVGIFAGDSLQYLSLVTAHGVIMVFFMIIPLISGAFANFLLPTQLGVHDVAFPRLNSAAFWFLPAGLIMLGQLICVDKRYQRMNCFNIREVQSLLKRRFFSDLMNTQDHHILLDNTMLNLRYKTNDFNSANPGIHLLYELGPELGPKFRTQTFSFDIFKNPSSATNFSNNTRKLFPRLVSFLFYSKSEGILSSLNFWVNVYLANPVYVLFRNFSYYIEGWNFCANLSLQLIPFTLTTPSLYFLFTSRLTQLSEFYFLIQLENSLRSLCSQIWTRIWHNKFFYSNAHLFFIEFKYQLMPNNQDLTQHHFRPFVNINDWKGYLQYFQITAKTPKYIITFFFDNVYYIFIDFFFFFDAARVDYSLNKFTKSNSRTAITPFWQFFKPTLLRSASTNQLSCNLNNDVFFTNNVAYIEISSLSKSVNYLFLHDSYFIFKMFWATFFYKNPSYKFKQVTNAPLWPLLDYESKTVYFYLLLNFFHDLPQYLLLLFKNLQDFPSILPVFNAIYTFFITWYIPLFFSVDSYLFFKFLSENPVLTYFGLTLSKLRNFFSFFMPNPRSFSPILTNFETFAFYLFTQAANLSPFFVFYNFLNYLVLPLIFCFYSVRPSLIFEHFIKFNSLPTFFYRNNADINNKKLTYSSSYFNNLSQLFQSKHEQQELSLTNRYQRFQNPIFKYDYKTGDYFPKLNKEVYTYLFSTIAELTSGLRASPWFFSIPYADSFVFNFSEFLDNVSKTTVLFHHHTHSTNSIKIANTDTFYNFFFLLSKEKTTTNWRWLSVNALNCKFLRLFHSSSMQQRLYANWRELKFTREAWRCKLLAARHQKTMYRRYVNEDGVFWSIERNAKDLLPGWAMITPFSSRTRFTAVGKTDIGLMGVFLVLNSSIVSAANFLVTYRYLSTLNNRKMRDARSFYTEGIIVSSWMMVAANPMLAIGIVMLLSDRHWQTSFFDYSGGGDTVLFQHMFWFFGHPEVYIVIIPVFGFTNTILSHFLKKRVSARASLLYSMYTIAFLGFFVWGHHMYMVGLSHTTRMLFSTLTVMISVPAATKIMHWCVTLANSAFTLELPLLCIFTFIFLFVSGGISGMCVAHTGMDVLFHDTFYVIGHFHVMFAGAAMFGSFGAFYFYFPAIFGVKYSRLYAYLHYTYYLIGQLMTFIPMFWLGYAGMPRRILDYPASLGGWHSVISAGHMLSVAGLISFFIMIFDSLRQGRAATRGSFGIGRYNIRLNFYLYEIARSMHTQRKTFYLFRFIRPFALRLNKRYFANFEHLETTLLSYTFTRHPLSTSRFVYAIVKWNFIFTGINNNYFIFFF